MQALEVAQKPYETIQWPELHLQTNWKISFAVITAHLLALWMIAFGAHIVAPKNTPKKLIVHTVTLQSTPAKFAPKMASATKQQVAAKKEEKATVAATVAPQPEMQKQEMQNTKEIPSEPEKPLCPAKAIVEEEAVPVNTPKPKEPPKAKPTPKPTPKPPAKAAPKVEKKPAKPKADTKKPEVKKAQIKQKDPPKAKNNEQSAKDKQAKETKNKETKNKEAKEKEQKAAQEKAAKAKAAKEQAAREQAAKQQAMIDKALSSLDSSGAIGGKKSTLAANAAKSAVAGPAAITSLSAESLVAIDASDTANCTPAERTYYDELVSRLKLALKLPEFGEVKLQLTISRAGKVVSVKNVQSKSKKNSDYAQKAIPKLHLPPFGQNFSGEKEHTFRLTLSNELTY